MRIYLEAIDVQTATGRPQRIIWRNRHYAVEQVVDFWVWQGRWWEAEERRVYMQLVTDGGTVEVFRRNQSWVMSRAYD